MNLWSDSWVNGDPIPARFAAGRLNPEGGVGFSDNINPHLAWSEVPAATRSFALICQDCDVPSRADDVNRTDREIPADLERVDFFHWVLIDMPLVMTEIAEGEFSRGFTARGKPGPTVTRARHIGLRQGLNDYTGWFKDDAEMAGQYFGYDGPFPPFNDSLVHHYVFTLYALDIARAPVSGVFTGAEVRQAIYPHVVGEGTFSGTYTLNRRFASLR